jgi:GNAT superfamily N-acetyltransferase
MTSTLDTPRGTVTIRSASADEADSLRALRVEAITQHPTSFGSVPQEVDGYDWVDLTGGATRDAAIFVAEHGGQFIGLTGVLRGNRVKDSHHADIWGVYVRESWRRLGLAAALVNAAAEWAAGRGVAIVKLTVVPESGAMDCYLRCGFRATGTDRAALKWDGRYYDEILMSRWTGNEPFASKD